MRWEFTSDEFMHVWKETGRDRYPFPLRLIASVRWEDEFEQIARELQRRLPLGSDPDVSAMLRVAADPEISLALTGARRRPLRVYGAIDSNIGVTFVQRPGSSADFGGNVVIELGSPTIVPKVFAAVLGDVPAGRQPALVESADRIRSDLESWSGTKETTSDRMRRLLRAPRAGSGHIEVLCGLRSTRPQPPQYLSWFDVEGDGRYLHRERHNDFHVMPCSREAIRNEIVRMTQRYSQHTH